MLKQTLDFLLNRNFFIALCVVSLYYVSRIINHLNFSYTPVALLLFVNTLLYYDFHHYSHRLDFSGLQNFIHSIKKIRPKSPQILTWFLAVLAIAWSMPSIKMNVLSLFLIVALFSFLYSVPVLKWKGRRIRIRESLIFKLPVLSLSYVILTVLVPIMEAGIPVFSANIFLYAGAQACFVFALCIPFEIRDLQKDSEWGVRTIPAVIGIRNSKLLGAIVLIAGMIMHHIPAFSYTFPALDMSFMAALLIVLFSSNRPTDFYCRFLTDGQMILQLILVYLLAK